MKRKKPHILLVDDDMELLKMLATVLHKSNFVPHVAVNGVEALSKVEELEPDLVVLDVMMPLMNGNDICRRLREQEATKELPIIMLSALDSVDDKLAGFEAGADDYVSKPVDPKELVARIHALLNRSPFGRQQLAYTVAIVGAKGGVGVTSVAVNVSVALAQREYAVTMAELHPSDGAVRHLLNQPDKRHLGPLLAMNPEDIERARVQRCLVAHSSGVNFLLAPRAFSEHPLTGGHVEQILGGLVHDVDFLIVDVPPIGDETLHIVAEFADYILLVSEPEIFSVTCARGRLQTFREWNVFDKVDVVAVARVPSGLTLTRMEVENEMGLGGSDSKTMTYWEAQRMGLAEDKASIVGVIPPAPELFQDAVSAGVPVVSMEPSARAARALSDLAEHVIENVSASERAEF